jgi:site-specific recombinase XerD
MVAPLPELIIQFLEHLEIEKNASKLTIRNYHHYLLIFCEWYSPTRSIETLSLGDIRTFRVFLSNKTDISGKQLEKTTQGYYIIALRSFLRFLMKNDIKTLEPSKIDLPKIADRQPHFLSREQVEQLVTMPDTSKEEGLRDRAILELLFSTGLRLSELVKLNHEQINFDRGEFGVLGKGGRARVVFLSDRAIEWLNRYLQARVDVFKPLFIRYSRGVDESDDGEKMRLTGRSVERIVKKYVRLARLPVDATVHTLRHSFATDLLMNGADIRSVQEMLGHRNIGTTQIYTHITHGQLQDVHKAFHSGNK